MKWICLEILFFPLCGSPNTKLSLCVKTVWFRFWFNGEKPTDFIIVRERLSILILLAAVLGENCFLRVSWCFSEKAITLPKEQMESLNESSLFPFAYLNDTSCPNILLLSSEFPASSALVDTKPTMLNDPPCAQFSIMYLIFVCECVSVYQCINNCPSWSSSVTPPPDREERRVRVLSAR